MSRERTVWKPTCCKTKFCYGKILGDSPKGAADADSLEKLFLQAVGNEVRCIGVDATGDVL